MRADAHRRDQLSVADALEFGVPLAHGTSALLVLRLLDSPCAAGRGRGSGWLR